jgi:hypothetical protein
MTLLTHIESIPLNKRLKAYSEQNKDVMMAGILSKTREKGKTSYIYALTQTILLGIPI